MEFLPPPSTAAGVNRQLVTSMFKVDLETDSTTSTTSQCQQDKMARNVNVPKKCFSFLVDRFDFPTLYPCLTARFTLLHLNTLTLQFIGLAICVAVFSALLNGALEITGTSASHSCAMYDVPFVTAVSLIRDQAYSGINATIWNMQQASLFGIDAAIQGFEYAVDCSEKKRPTAKMSQNISGLAVLSAKSQVNAIMNVTQSQLKFIMDRPVPVANSTANACVTAGLKTKNKFGIEIPTKAWEATFSIAAVLAIILAGYKEFYFWHYELAVASDLTKCRPFDFLETAHSMLHYVGSSMADSLSRLIIRFDHHPHELYIRWALNYAFASHLNRLLQICLFLGTLGIANSTLIASAKPFVYESSECASLSQTNGLYSQFQRSLNQNLEGLISAAVVALEANHLKFVQKLKNTDAIDMGNVSTPLGNGVAIEYVTLPKAKDYNSCRENCIGNDISGLLSSINSAIWLSSITLLVLWFVFAGIACGYALYKACKTPEGSGKKRWPFRIVAFNTSL